MPMSDDGNEYDNYQDDLDNEYQENDNSNSSEGEDGEFDENENETVPVLSKTVQISQTTKTRIDDDMTGYNIDEDDKLEEIEDSQESDDSEDSFQYNESMR